MRILILAAALAAAAAYADNPEREAKAAFLLDGEPPSAKAEGPGHEFDVLHYRLSLSIDTTSGYINGVASLTCRSEVAGLSQLRLTLAHLPVSSVMSGGVPLSYVYNDWHLYITPSVPLALGEEITFDIAYDGTPTTGLYYTPHCTYTMTEPDRSKYWFPCYDLPLDKATAELIITVPDDRIVASNGVLLSDTDNGDGTRTFHWREDHQIATYLISVAISDYVVWSQWHGDLEIRNFVYPQDYADSLVDFEQTPDMLAFYESVICEYPFDKYGMAEAPFGGAMEHQSCTTFGEVLIRGDKTYEWVVAHELAHQWWGDYVTPAGWEDMWLNEGFATYFDALYTEHRDGAAAFAGRLANFAQTYFNEDANIRYSMYDPERLFGSVVYEKGAWVLHMLRGVVGETVFWSILPEYAGRYAFGNANTEDLITVCGDQYGADLHWFFDPWVYEAGHPVYGLEWSAHEASKGWQVDVSVAQGQSEAPLFEMPIEFHIHTTSGVVVETVTVDEMTEEFSFSVDEEPTGVVLDEDSRVLKKTDGPQFSATPEGWLAPGWNLISLPLEPNEPHVEAVLDNCIDAGNVLDNSLYGYSPASGYAIYPAEFTEFERGMGYWLCLSAPAREVVFGTEAGGPVSMDLVEGWNLIGHPHDGPVPWASCTLADGVQTLTLAQAEAAGWVQAAAYWYDNGYHALAPSGGEDDTLRPWRSVWLLTYRPGLSLTVPAP